MARDGVQKMGFVMQDIAEAMKDCDAVDEDISFINKIAEPFLKQENMVVRLSSLIVAVDDVNIYGELFKFFDSYQYYQMDFAGAHVAHAALKVYR
mmetsp:Transcript_24643/g.21871  ORF Transcript_24643/g.21871 Transcript_24643/m.21871 type:complete len:95 (-) Transcript_24643:43-327(-)